MTAKEESGTAATAPLSTPKETTDATLAFTTEDVKNCLSLGEILNGIDATNKEISKSVQTVFPAFNRQLLTQASNWERYGVIIHPQALKHICETYSTVPPKRKAQPRRRAKHQLTFRVTENVRAAIQSFMDLNEISTVQCFLEFAVRYTLENTEGKSWVK